MPITQKGWHYLFFRPLLRLQLDMLLIDGIVRQEAGAANSQLKDEEWRKRRKTQLNPKSVIEACCWKGKQQQQQHVTSCMYCKKQKDIDTLCAWSTKKFVSVVLQNWNQNELYNLIFKPVKRHNKK